MGKAMPKFSVGDLPAASCRTDAQSASKDLGTIPSWASEPFDLNEPTDPAPSGLISHPLPRSAAADIVRTGPSSFVPLKTVAEAAAALHVSTKTIRRMIGRGELHRVKMRRLVRLRAEDIAQYIRDCIIV
jgi:excisionase family DNA binding protein